MFLKYGLIGIESMVSISRFLDKKFVGRKLKWEWLSIIDDAQFRMSNGANRQTGIAFHPRCMKSYHKTKNFLFEPLVKKHVALTGDRDLHIQLTLTYFCGVSWKARYTPVNYWRVTRRTFSLELSLYGPRW